ncbi:MAG: carbamoyl phosphate synthase small subunit [Oscillospiraceae bacterium]|jgi:carbamoyl-phosphate synthase small subunit|nr:carbamoyl phosphate synthase small subunit [Oscillospiraceae bacterium]
METAYLVLANGQIFTGRSFASPIDGSAIGEVVFTTAMTGYVETLTDPSYAGQIVLQTFPLIGNYGVMSDDQESRRVHVRAYIVKDPCGQPSNFRSEGSLAEYLRAYNIPGLCGIDTRALTRLIREHGVLNGAITNDPRSVNLDALRGYEVRDALKQVREVKRREYGVEEALARVVLWDFGLKNSQIMHLVNRGCSVIRVASEASAEQILAEEPDGVLLSNGPGDPRENTALIAEIGKLAKSGVPIMGICLGHQLLALSQGGTVEKLKYGHRGANHPVRDVISGRAHITSQNHGYAVAKLPANSSLRYENINDGTVEGVDYTDFKGFSAQFHPEASAGPEDTAWLFDRFIELMSK